MNANTTNDHDSGNPAEHSLWYRVADRLGVPVLVICFTGFCLVNLAGWIGPQIERLLDGHIEFMGRTASSAEKAAEATKVSAGIQVEIKEAIQEIKTVGQEQVDNTRESLKMQREVLDELKRSKGLTPQSKITPSNIPFVLHQSP